MDVKLAVAPHGEDAFEIQQETGPGHSVQVAVVNLSGLLKRDAALELTELLASAPALKADLLKADVLADSLYVKLDTIRSEVEKWRDEALERSDKAVEPPYQSGGGCPHSGG